MHRGEERRGGGSKGEERTLQESIFSVHHPAWKCDQSDMRMKDKGLEETRGVQSRGGVFVGEHLHWISTPLYMETHGDPLKVII